jgi:site-specific DNA-methyltransferase (cytosine-N4-specific)
VRKTRNRAGALQNQFDFHGKGRLTVPGFSPYSTTALGDAYLADPLPLLKALRDASIDVVLTSPPYTQHLKKEYGNADKSDYVDWFCHFGREILRVLTPDGSFILNIGRSDRPGAPTRSLYHFKLLIELVEPIGFHPFAGSNTTGAVAETLGLRWVAVEVVESYLEASRFRFFS